MFPEDIWYILPNPHLMFFDRYEIHIQASVHFIDGKLIMFQASSPQEYFKKYIRRNYTYKYFLNK